MRAIVWLVVLVLVVIGVAAIVEYFDLFGIDVPMIDVRPQAEMAVEVISAE